MLSLYYKSISNKTYSLVQDQLKNELLILKKILLNSHNNKIRKKKRNKMYTYLWNEMKLWVGKIILTLFLRRWNGR